jgi:hypothetical protein
MRIGHKSSLRERVLAMIAVLSVAAWLALLLWNALSVEPLDQAGRKILNAMLRRDGATVYRYLLPKERTQFGHSPARLQAFLDRIMPEPGSLKMRDWSFIPMYGDTALACDVFVESPEGVVARYDIVVHPTDEGPRAGVISSVVTDSFLVKYGASDPNVPQQVWVWRAIHIGIRKYKDDLLQMGIKGFYEDDGRFATWEWLEPYAERTWKRAASQKR